MSDKLIVTLVDWEDSKEHFAEVLSTDLDARLPEGGFGAVNVDDFLMEHLEEVRSVAAKKVAARFVEYPEGGGSDSEYAKEIDGVADGLYFKDVKVADVDRRQYEVDAQYSPNSDYQPWTDVVEAGDESEAMFQARLELARNEGWDVLADAGTPGLSASDATEGLLGQLSDFEIFSVVPVADLAETLLKKLVVMAEGAGDAEEIVSLLKSEGRRIVGVESVMAEDASPAP